MTAIPFNRPSIVGREIQYIRDAVSRGQLSGDGVYTHKCQDAIRGMTDSERVLITHSCTAALEMAAILCDLKAGDEVLMPSFTFVSTANAVVLRGAKPVFVDIEPSSLNIDPEMVRRYVTPRTRAIFAVHYAGIPADMDSLSEIAEEHNLFLVEDAAQALGSSYKGRPAGSLGDMAAFSFHETKNVISGEGGALAINRKDLVERAEIIREKGTNRSQFFRGNVDKYTWVDIGSSFLPGELIAAYLYAQLECAPDIKARRLETFNIYRNAFSEVADQYDLELPRIPDHCTGNGHMFYVLMSNLEARSKFIAGMRRRGIVTPFHYVPLHNAPAGRKYGYTPGPMPVTERVSETLVRLPLYYDLEGDVASVIENAIDLMEVCR